jgi:outer membrane lipoprotein carrier protein
MELLRLFDMPRLVAVIAWVGLAYAFPVAQARPTADALARSLHQRYQGIHDFSADFVHSYRGGVLRKQVTERGTLEVKKPGMMRWEYTSPERKTFVSDGRKMYSYIPQDRQVIVSPVPTEDNAATPALFLAGKGDVTRDFTATFAEPAAIGTYALKLLPRTPDTDYDYLVVQLDPATLQIRGLTTFDHQGGESTFTFTNLKENRGLSDKDFAFRIPHGVDVVTDDRVSR